MGNLIMMKRIGLMAIVVLLLCSGIAYTQDTDEGSAKDKQDNQNDPYMRTHVFTLDIGSSYAIDDYFSRPFGLRYEYVASDAFTLQVYLMGGVYSFDDINAKMRETGIGIRYYLDNTAPFGVYLLGESGKDRTRVRVANLNTIDFVSGDTYRYSIGYVFGDKLNSLFVGDLSFGAYFKPDEKVEWKSNTGDSFSVYDESKSYLSFYVGFTF